MKAAVAIADEKVETDVTGAGPTNARESQLAKWEDSLQLRTFSSCHVVKVTVAWGNLGSLRLVGDAAVGSIFTAGPTDAAISAIDPKSRIAFPFEIAKQYV